MKFITQILKLKTRKELDFINISNKILVIFKKLKIKNGFINIYSKHTTLAIIINEYEKFLLKDMRIFMEKLTSEKMYFHDNIKLRKDCSPDEPENARGHLRCMLMEAFQTIPIINYKLQLGKYQQVIVIETSGPRTREIIIQILGEEK